MAVKALISTLEEEILDPEEETFFLFSHEIPSSNLGFIDPKATELSLTLAGRDFTIHQSPTVLSSTRAGGTTGADRRWRFFLLPLLLVHPGVIAFQPLDWELDTPDPSLTGSSTIRSFDAIVCCDCIYNEALVAPLVSATADLARLRHREREDRAEARDSANNNALLQDHHSSAFSSSPSSHADRSEPCVCIVAQQLRSPDVFEEWARAFHRDFRVWRVPDALLPEGLRIDSGFVVHVGILREAETDF
ncbi:hypothetical protein CH35J_008283 [Colletotrichum higginsianum]|uniref:Uncharacterized protein n=1 Tax=Colletotrichum higginsianum TaxID=80884 RepID=A0A4T0VTD4_9PEZI|nr:hypothetical protein CH35J_008283 [Colletotrichum higginsianum]